MKFYLMVAAVCLFVLGTNSNIVCQQNLADDHRDEKAIDELKQDGSYNSLADAFKKSGALVANDERSQSRFSQQNKLTAPGGAANDWAGYHVALAGNTVVIGAHLATVGSNEKQGAAYVFVRNSSNVWAFQQKLTAPDGAATDSFGISVAIADIPTPAETVIMVGAYANDANGHPNQGAVYTFERVSGGTTWTQQQKLTASDGVANDTFGVSISMTSSFVIIGAHNADTPGRVDVGAAYIFARSLTNWVEEQKLTTPGGGTDERHFGFSVAISGSLAVVGTNVAGTNQGGFVYIFERVNNSTTWLTQMAFTGSGKYGYSVALSGESLIVGSPEFVVGSNQQGMVNFYARVNGVWTDQGNYTASDGAANDAFGTSIAISGNTAVVGSDYDDNGAVFNQGSAYVFARSGTTWNEQQRLIASDGGAAEYFGIGVALDGSNVLVGSLSNVGGNSFQGAAYVFSLTKNAPFDFDGDGKTDVGIFRSGPGEWWINRSSNAATFALQFGQSSDKLAPADFTGDGKTDVAFWRPSTGSWFILRSEDNSFYAFPFGANGDVPVPADYDGDGKADAAVFRPSTLTWYISKSSGGTDIIGFGAAGDKPVIADYDGDGKADIAIYRSNGGNSEWWIRRSSNGSVTAFQFGLSSDKAVEGDYTGDGKTDVAVFRPSNGNWLILRSENSSFYSFPFGSAGDVPTPGDYDGDGKTDAAVFRPSGSTWYASRSSGGTLIQQFGIAGDTPLPSVFVP